MTELDKITFSQMLFHAPVIVNAHPDPANRAKIASLIAYLMSLTLGEYEFLIASAHLTQHLITGNRSHEDDTVQLDPDAEMFGQFRLDEAGWLYPLDFRLEQILNTPELKETP